MGTQVIFNSYTSTTSGIKINPNNGIITSLDDINCIMISKDEYKALKNIANFQYKEEKKIFKIKFSFEEWLKTYI